MATRMRFRHHRLQLQLLFSVVAALSVAALSILLILEAVRSAERIVIADAHHSLNRALDELTQQYRDRVNGDPNWPELPREAQDLSLRAITAIVVRSYRD